MKVTKATVARSMFGWSSEARALVPVEDDGGLGRGAMTPLS